MEWIWSCNMLKRVIIAVGGQKSLSNAYKLKFSIQAKSLNPFAKYNKYCSGEVKQILK